MKPKYCGGCRPNDMVHVQYNLRVYLQSKGLLWSYIIYTSDVNACSAFGKELAGAENSTSGADHESDSYIWHV